MSRTPSHNTRIQSFECGRKDTIGGKGASKATVVRVWCTGILRETQAPLDGARKRRTLMHAAISMCNHCSCPSPTGRSRKSTLEANVVTAFMYAWTLHEYICTWCARGCSPANCHDTTRDDWLVISLSFWPQNSGAFGAVSTSRVAVQSQKKNSAPNGRRSRL